MKLDIGLVVATLKRPNQDIKDGSRRRMTSDCQRCPWYRKIHNASLCGKGRNFLWLSKVPYVKLLPCKSLWVTLGKGPKEFGISGSQSILYLDQVVRNLETQNAS